MKIFEKMLKKLKNKCFFLNKMLLYAKYTKTIKKLIITVDYNRLICNYLF